MAYTRFKPKSSQQDPTRSITWAITIPYHNSLLNLEIPLLAFILNKYFFIYLVFSGSYILIEVDNLK